MRSANLARSISASLLFLIASGVFAVEQEVWSDVSEAQIPASGDRWIVPSSYRTVALDRIALMAVLHAAPLEGSANAKSVDVTLVLPLPDGDYGRFRILESPIMEPGLAAKYPEIRTYLGQGIDDTSATLRFDLTPAGFHAAIHSPRGRIYIDPYSRGDTIHHISYYTANHHRTEEAEAWRCLASEEHQTGEQQTPERTPDLPNGDVLRIYRTAIAATGEYTIFHSADEANPTVAEGMAAIVTAINRVNEIYEREVALRHVLVDNNDEIVYTDPKKDPYTDETFLAILQQNQDNLDNVIQTSNYDIGHLFAVDVPSAAWLRSPCNRLHKARGASSLSEPTGDAYWVDYVAHELGHQWGAQHTFNGTAVPCAGNRNPSTAYEPGSGSTIMSYAGLCGNQNIQEGADDYFHGISFQEIVNFITTGEGNNCGTSMNTGNTPPTPDAGVPYTIPNNTPFKLCGSATDPDGDTLSFRWEQFNLGPAGHPNLPFGDAPIFRSFPSSPTPCRMFPQLADLQTNTPTIGELLPSFTRTLNFRMLARDNRGGADYDEVEIRVIRRNPSDLGDRPFRVTSPNTTTHWSKGSVETVTWDVADTDQAPINCTQVDILLSTDRAETFAEVLANGTANDGSEKITVPDLETSQARVQVRCSDNIFFDISDRDFHIVGGLIFEDGFESGDLSAWKSLVGGGNAGPQVSIVSPVDGASFTEGTEIPFVAFAADPEDGDLTASLRWESATAPIVGDFGAGGCLVFDGLLAGHHKITATVTDSNNQNSSQTISITIVPSPAQHQKTQINRFDRFEAVAEATSIGKFASTQIPNGSGDCPDMDPDMGLQLSADKPQAERDPIVGKYDVFEKCGKSGLENVKVISNLPPGLKFLCKADCPEETTETNASCNLGNIPAGGHRTYYVIVTDNEDTESATWKARAEASNADPVEAVVNLDLSLLFSDGFELGDTLGWAVTVR